MQRFFGKATGQPKKVGVERMWGGVPGGRAGGEGWGGVSYITSPPSTSTTRPLK